jgi:hypothetical protein
MVKLDRRGRTVRGCATFDNIGIKGPLGEEPRSLDFPGLFLEAFDEGVPDPPPFLLRFGDSLEGVEEFIFGLHDVQISFKVSGKLGDDGRLLILAQQTVIHQDAGELRADGLVEQGGGDAAVDSPDKPQITRSLPTTWRIESTDCSTKLLRCQRPSQPAML